MNCDVIAPFYRYLEYAAFGKALERRRFEFLREVFDSRRALVLGDGDGRFTAQLLLTNSKVEVDYVELSGKMIELAKRRIPEPSRVRFLETDALTYHFPARTYDLIVSHFFFDCFSEQEAGRLIAKISASACDNAQWMIAEFRQPEDGWRAVHAFVWLRSMYLFFRVATGLRTKVLPPYGRDLLREGFLLRREKEERGGLMASEWWTRSAMAEKRLAGEPIVGLPMV